jgi:hypothetical protein
VNTFSEGRHISVTIARSPAEVYAFAREPSNLPQWAKGLSGAIERIDGEWIADSPMGKVKVRFVEQNPFGVLDHHVVLPSGESVYNPMRVVANGQGSEVIFTIFRRPNTSDAAFTADVDAVTRDLAELKRLLER